jgi:hypothetical protein
MPVQVGDSMLGVVRPWRSWIIRHRWPISAMKAEA